MTTPSRLESIAEKLRDAYRGGPIPPIRSEIGAENIEAAYRIQSLNTNYWKGSGRHIVGRKIGLTSDAVQRQLKVNQPDFGVLFADMLIENGAALLRHQMLQPRIEAEIAFVLGKDIIAAESTPIDIIAATAYILPALEIVDSRIRGWDITIADTVADNASSGFFVLGLERTDVRALDLQTCEMLLEVDGREASRGLGSACLGHPLNAVRWLANTLVQFGDPLRAGDIVLSGALGPMVSLNGIRRVETSISGVGSVSVSIDDSQA
jgi:2-keto-4-pentenoate hydratase